MSAFDVAICMGQQNLNQVTGTLYQRPGLRNSLFRGTVTDTIADIQVTIAWDILQAPQFSLNPPSPSQWAAAITAEGSSSAPTANAFIVNLPALRISRTPASGPLQETTTALDVVCTIQIAGNAVALSPLGVVIDLSHASAFDRIMYRKIIIPQVLRQVGNLLKGQHLPNINFQGLAFGDVVLMVDNGRATAAANLLARGTTPDQAVLKSLPPGEFYVLLGGDALQQVVQSGVQPLVGRQDTASGNASFGIGNANYSVSLRIDSLNAQARSPTSLGAQAGVTVSASAGIDVFAAIMKQIENGVTDAAVAVANAATDAAKAVGDGVTDAAKTVGDGVTDAAKTVGDGVTDAAKTVGGGVTAAAEAVGDAFKSY